MATRKTTPKSSAAKRPAAAKPAAKKATATKTVAAAKAPAAKAAAAKSKPAAKKPAAAKPVVEPATPLFATETVESMVPLAEEAMKPVEAAVAASTDTLEAVVKAGTQAATKGYEQAVAMTQEQVEKASSSVFDGYEEAATLGKENMDAYVVSSTVVAQGFEAFGKEVISFAQAAVEANMAAAQALVAAKSFQEVIELQSEYSRNSIDSVVAESAKLTDISIALAHDAMEPLQTRVTVTVEKMIKPLAA